MSEHATDDEPNQLPVESQPANRPPPLTAEVVTGADRRKECTVYPRDATGFERTTTWITAAEGSYVCVEQMR